MEEQEEWRGREEGRCDWRGQEEWRFAVEGAGGVEGSRGGVEGGNKWGEFIQHSSLLI